MTNPVGKNIRKIRSVKGLSQSAFGELFDVSRSNIAAYEESRAMPKLDLVGRMAKHFHIDLESMLTKELTVNAISNFKELSVDGSSPSALPVERNVLAEKKIERVLSQVQKMEKELERLKKDLNELKGLV